MDELSSDCTHESVARTDAGADVYGEGTFAGDASHLWAAHFTFKCNWCGLTKTVKEMVNAPVWVDIGDWIDHGYGLAYAQAALRGEAGRPA